MKNQQIIRINSHKPNDRNNHYYAMEKDKQSNKKGIRNICATKSGSSTSRKSTKGISLSKNIKKSFEDFYTGIPIKQNISKIQPIMRPLECKTIENQVINIKRIRSLEPHDYKTNHYQYQNQYRIIHPLIHKISTSTSSQTEQSSSLNVQKYSSHSSTDIHSKQSKNSLYLSQSILQTNSNVRFQKPASDIIQLLRKNSSREKITHPLSQSSLGRIPISQSIYVEPSILNQYFKKNKVKNEREV